MTEEAPKSSGWGLWGFVESVTATVKQKSDEIINIYKEDLQEFSRTIVNDTSAVIKEEVAKLSALNLGKEEKRVKGSTARPNPHEARLQRIQRDPKTYTEAPQEEEYETWATAFNVGAPENTETITHLLTSNEAVREFHTSLVPAKVSYRDFWCRYYFRVHKLEEEEKRRAAILNNANINDEEEFSWDVDEEKPASPSLPSSTPSTSSTPSSSLPTSPIPSTPSSISTPEATSPIPPRTPPPTPASDVGVSTVDNSIPVAEEIPTPTTPPTTTTTTTTATTPSTPSKVEIPEFNEESFDDDIEAEIAKKYETQKQDEAPTTPPKTEVKSDAEDGWADWE